MTVLPALAQAQPGRPQPSQVINLGHVEVWEVLDLSTPPPPAPATIQAGVGVLIPGTALSLADAQALIDFPLLQPSWLPAPDIQLGQVRTLGIGTLPNPLVTLVYHDAALDPSAPGYRELILQQQRWAGIGPFILHQPLEVGRIGDQPAAFWTRRNSASVPVVGGMERSLVMWECGELLLTLDATGFSRDELVQVAQGLTDQP